MHVGVCIVVVIMILLIADIIWVSIRRDTNKQSSIKDYGGAATTDVCKCDGSVAVIYWMTPGTYYRNGNPYPVTIVYVKVGYRQLPIYNPAVDIFKFSDTNGHGCPEFYHENVARWYYDGIPTRKNAYTWYFRLLPQAIDGKNTYNIMYTKVKMFDPITAATTPAGKMPSTLIKVNNKSIVEVISDNEVSFGSAGVAEVYGRFYILHRIMSDPIAANSLISVDFAANKGGVIENCPWKPFYNFNETLNMNQVIPWGGHRREGELFRFVFRDTNAAEPQNSVIQSSLHDILETCIRDLDNIFNAVKPGTMPHTDDIDETMHQVLQNWNGRVMSSSIASNNAANVSDIFEKYIDETLYIKTFTTVPSRVKCSWKPWCRSCEQVDIPNK